MRFFAAETDYKNRKAVVSEHPAAVKIVKTCGGWAVFEYWTDYEIHQIQINGARKTMARIKARARRAKAKQCK